MGELFLSTRAPKVSLKLGDSNSVYVIYICSKMFYPVDLLNIQTELPREAKSQYKLFSINNAHSYFGHITFIS